MNISFGILVGPNFDIRTIRDMINLVILQNWDGDDEYEILLIGQDLPTFFENYHHVRIIPFDENPPEEP